MGRPSWILLGTALALAPPLQAVATTYYVRQTVGDDSHDGTSPETAWLHIAKLSGAMHAGDVAYVGPGLYREQITVLNDGTADKRISFIADPSGQRSGDPPGVVMITGAEPMDTSTFVADDAPGVYTAPFSRPVWGLVEMDGDQSRYWRVKSTQGLPQPEGVTELDMVAQRPSSFYYDEKAKILLVHTSDDKLPATHEMEILARDHGIGMEGKHYVTVMGFTFRHMVDAGIGFYNASGDVIAIDNTSYGSRQGIRAHGTHIAVVGNTLFRNENSGVYFLLQSTNSFVVRNAMYENIKGVRWSSQSANGTAVDNTLFDNQQAGISIESADHIILRHNKVVNNGQTQLNVLQAEYASDDNCFANGGSDQLIADLPFVGRYRTLADYQRGVHQDVSSREGGCGPLPDKVDVHKLDAEARGYADRARRILSGAKEGAGEPKAAPVEEAPAARGWLQRLLGR